MLPATTSLTSSLSQVIVKRANTADVKTPLNHLYDSDSDQSIVKFQHLQRALRDKRRVQAYDSRIKESLHKQVLKRAAAAKLADRERLLNREKKRTVQGGQLSLAKDTNLLLGIVEPVGFTVPSPSTASTTARVYNGKNEESVKRGVGPTRKKTQ